MQKQFSGKAKNILITGAGSDMAKALIKMLSASSSPGFNIFATYRKEFPVAKEGFAPLFLDVCDDASFLALGEKLSGVKLDAVVNFAGYALTSPVSELNSEDLIHQTDTVFIGLSRLLKFVYPYLTPGAKVVNVSSMAAFGIFPFISPYCASKAAADILLNSFEIETGIRCVSIKPGVVQTKFWQYCIDLNRENFKNFSGEYEKTGRFLLKNAKDNEARGVLPEDVAKVIYKVINKKHPRHSYLVGKDAYFASLSRFIPKGVLNFLIRKILNYRVRKFDNGK